GALVNQIIFICRNIVTSHICDVDMIGFFHRNDVIEVECDADAVVARAHIRTRCRYLDRYSHLSFPPSDHSTRIAPSAWGSLSRSSAAVMGTLSAAPATVLAASSAGTSPRTYHALSS